MFTRDQIEEIKKKLIMLGTKDTQFPDAHKLNGEEIIAIVQDGENKKIPLSSIINDDFINVSKDTTEILTLSTAVSKIDINNRKLGQVITFKDSANSWAIRQFTGSSLDNWNDISLWKSISGIDELKSQVETNAENISVLSDEIERHDASILNLGTEVSKLKDKDTETSSSLSELTTRVDTLKSQTDTNTSNISSINTEVSTLRSKVDENTTSISQINTELDNKSDEIAQINNTLAEHTESINAKITTDRIKDGAVTSEKISSSAFDDTLSVSGKIAPADVVGRKLTNLESEINGLDTKDKMVFETEDILSQISSSFVAHKYPAYIKGNINTSSSSNPVGYYIIPFDLLQNYYSVKAYLQCDGPAPAAIAFYSSEDSYTSSTYLGGVQHEKTSGKWFEIKVPNNAKSCLITNRPTSSSSPIILVLKKEKIVKEIVDIQEQLLPREYTETLIGTVNIAENATTGKLAINCYRNEIIKLVIDDNNRRVYVGTTNYGNDICEALASGTYYIQLQKSVETIYFYRSGGDNTKIGTIQVYKCSDIELFNINPVIQSFYKYHKGYIFDNNKMILNHQWSLNSNNIAANGTDATTELLQIYKPKLKITLSDTTNYKFYIVNYPTIYPAIYDGQVSSWLTNYEGVLNCCSFAITIRKNSGGNITQEDLSVISIEFVEPYLEYYTTKSDLEETKLEILNSVNLIGSINNGLNVIKPYYYHFSPDSFIMDGNGNSAIPSQTSFDIEVAARLGFTFIEANIHSTSDGNFICMHGSGGNFGSTVYSLDNSDISNVAINTKTLNWIKENVRFNSYYDKYKVSPLSLEEFCKCCKVNGIGIFAGTDNLSAINICMKILGTDNIMLYNAGSDKRQHFKGMMFVWNNRLNTTTASILSTARQHGIPFMYGLGPNLLSTLVSNGELGDLCTQMHNEGFTLASTAVYDTEVNTQNAFEAGVDFSASGHQVNPFENADIVYDLNDSSTFSGTGSIENGIASLANGETIICGDDSSIPLGKGMLIIRFNGSLTINFGSIGSRTLSSDGIKDIIISDYFFIRKSKLTISATGSTTIMNLIYKIKKC